MNIIETDFADVFIVEPTIFDDARGYFYESYNSRDLEKHGVTYNFVQDNQSSSSYGVVRGLHYQASPYAQTKLVRVLVGRVLDVIVDLRRSSKTFGKYFSVELSDTNHRQLLVPRGFAHGFSVLSEKTIFTYKCDNFYCKEAERSIAFDDKTLQIDWQIPAPKIIVSEKDQTGKSFEEAEKF